jgi:hypothetical protein
MGRQTGTRRTAVGLFLLFLLSPCFVYAQDVKTWQLKTAQFKQWLDVRQGDNYKFWTRIDGTRRPHKLYLGEGFNKADLKDKEEFIDTFSHYLAGHPDKFMLIDLYDAGTGEAIGEFGWGGFKLFVGGPAQPAQEKAGTAMSVSTDAEVTDSKGVAH